MNQDENRSESRLSRELLAKKLTLFPTGKIEAEQLVVAMARALDTEF